MGHVNKRAQTQEDIDYSKSGWVLAQRDFSEAFLIINLNVSALEPSTPKVQDPFAANRTVTQVVYDLLDNLEVKQNVKVWFNNKIWAALPIANNILTNALLRQEDTFDGNKPQ